MSEEKNTTNFDGDEYLRSKGIFTRDQINMLKRRIIQGGDLPPIKIESKQKNYGEILAPLMGDCGVIFFNSLDPTSIITSTVQSTPYNTCGIYYKYRKNNSLPYTYVVIMVWMNTMYRPLDTPEDITIDYLINNNLISDFIFREFNPSTLYPNPTDLENIKTSFKTTAALISEDGAKRNLTQILSQMFGYNTNDTRGSTSVEFLNKLFYTLGLDSYFPQVGVINISNTPQLPSALNTDEFGKIQTLSVMMSYLRTQITPNPGLGDKLLASYLTSDTTVLGPLIPISLPARDPFEQQEDMQRNNSHKSGQTGEILEAFTKLLINDIGFASKVIEGINQRRMEEYVSDQSMITMIQAMNQKMLDMMNILNNMYATTTLNWSDIQQWQAEAFTLSQQSSIVTGIPLPLPPAPAAVPILSTTNITLNGPPFLIMEKKNQEKKKPSPKKVNAVALEGKLKTEEEEEADKCRCKIMECLPKLTTNDVQDMLNNFESLNSLSTVVADIIRILRNELEIRKKL